MACTIEIGGVNGEAVTGAGLPTQLVVYARREGDCDEVELTVRTIQNGPPIFVGSAEPDSNGTVSRTFYLEPPFVACGQTLWVEARCKAGGDCLASAPVELACKSVPESPDDDDWTWTLPPELFCPLIGQGFTIALLAGIVTALTSVAMASVAVFGVGIAIIAGAFGVLAVWRHWCAIPPCYFWGAILWVLKRSLLAAVILTVVFISVPTLLCSLAVGFVAGGVTNHMRKMHCPLPHITTPLNQLPLW